MHPDHKLLRVHIVMGAYRREVILLKTPDAEGTQAHIEDTRGALD